MAFSHGKNTYFSVEDSAGTTLRNISPYCNEISFPREADLVETTTFGASYKTFVAGFTDATISVSGNWDPVATTGPDVVLSGLLGAAGTFGFEFGPAGNTGTFVKYSGEVILTNYEVSSAIDGVAEFSAEFQVSGAITRGTF